MKMPNKYEIIQAIKRDDGIAFEKQLEGTGCDLERLNRVVGIIFSGIPSPFKADSNTVVVSRSLSPKRFVS
jgi:hypothetical protein